MKDLGWVFLRGPQRVPGTFAGAPLGCRHFQRVLGQKGLYKGVPRGINTGAQIGNYTTQEI